MKRFGFAALAVVIVGAMALSACGSAEKEKELQSKLDACSADKQKLEARVAELEAAASPAATAEASPAPTAASGKATPKKTAAPAATTAAPAATTATPVPSPTLPTNIKLPGKLPGKK